MPATRPNILLIMADQWHHADVGYRGHPVVHTPCLPEFLQRHGCHTFHVGKHHCNPFGDRLGFDEFTPTLPEDMYQATDPEVTYMAWCRAQKLEYPNDQVHGDDVRNSIYHDEGELYCLTKDPEERCNRFGYPACQPRRIELLGELIDYIACKIRPITIMSGGDEARDRMLFSRGFGFCGGADIDRRWLMR